MPKFELKFVDINPDVNPKGKLQRGPECHSQREATEGPRMSFPKGSSMGGPECHIPKGKLHGGPRISTFKVVNEFPSYGTKRAFSDNS
jgi:hypothetical protein